MPDRCRDIGRERLERIMKLQHGITRRKNIDRIGSLEPILVSEKLSSQLYIGRGYYQAPEVDGITMIKSTRALPTGSFVQAVLKAVRNYDMIWEAFDEASP